MIAVLLLLSYAACGHNSAPEEAGMQTETEEGRAQRPKHGSACRHRYMAGWKACRACLPRIPKTMLYYDGAGSGRSRQTRTYFETKRNTSVFN